MNKLSFRRSVLVVAAVAALSVTAFANGDEALSSAFGAARARLTAVAQLKVRSQTHATAQFQFQNAQTSGNLVTLSCQWQAGGTVAFGVNYATGLFAQLAPSGKAYPNRMVTAVVSPNSITWNSEFLDSGTNPPTVLHWEGHIDRLSGKGWVVSYRPDYGGSRLPMELSCRRGDPIF